MEIIVRTNKATVYKAADGSVAKQYHTVDATERALEDARSLGHISEALAKVNDGEGWRYTVVRPLRVNASSGTIWLAWAPGQAVFTFDAEALGRAEYHVGRWLAKYHKCLLGETDEGLIFWDMTVHNILVDFSEKVVTGFDPGSNWGSVGNRYQDLIYHIYSLVVALLLRRRAGSLRAIRSFLQGYGCATAQRMDVTAYATALRKEARRQWNDYGMKSKLKQLAFGAGGILLLPLFAIYIPAVLARAMKPGRSPTTGRGATV
jgi:tRNA A-37 threonylcarbamoyl transferase component Bud32